MKNLLFVPHLFCLLFISIFAHTAQAQNNEYLKIRVIPAIYETIVDSIVVIPALNANFDTSNYFTKTEFIIVNEPSIAWQKNSENTICIVRKEAEYINIDRRFYPFKNILEIENAEEIIPAQIQTIKRKILLSPARLEKLSMDSPTNENDNIIIIKVKDWIYWQNFIETCQKNEENSSL